MNKLTLHSLEPIRVPTLSSNSSITLRMDPTFPGLGVTLWISNGVDILESAVASPSTRLYPTGLKKVIAEGEIVMSFGAIFETPITAGTAETFGRGCATWANEMRSIGVRLLLMSFGLRWGVMEWRGVWSSGF